MGVEAQEVDELTSRIDFCLVHVFSLREHGGRVDAGAPWSCQHVGSFQENTGAVLPAEGGPTVARLKRRIDGRLNVFGFAKVGMADDPFVVMGWGQGALVIGKDGFAADYHGDLYRVLVEHALIFCQLGSTFRTSWAVAQDRFIFGVGDLKKCVGHVVRIWAQR